MENQVNINSKSNENKINNNKILIIIKGVGKSSLLCRFIDDKFSNNFLTTLG